MTTDENGSVELTKTIKTEVDGWGNTVREIVYSTEDGYTAQRNDSSRNSWTVYGPGIPTFRYASNLDGVKRTIWLSRRGEWDPYGTGSSERSSDD